jgi:thioredoxin-like negative regulator of GroEL
VAKVDADHAQGVSVRFGIRGLPTVVLFQGGAEAGRVVGADPAGLRELVKGALGAGD